MRFSPCSTHLRCVAPRLRPPRGQELSLCPQRAVVTGGQRCGLSEAGVCNPSSESSRKGGWKHGSHVPRRVGNSPPCPHVSSPNLVPPAAVRSFRAPRRRQKTIAHCAPREARKGMR